MAIDVIEGSVDLGKPIFLYEAIYDKGPGSALRYISSVNQTIANGKTWSPYQIKHSEIVSSGSLDKQTLTVSARKDIPLAELFRLAPPSTVVQFRIYRGYLDSQDFVLEWNGRIINAMWKGAEVEFSCEPISTSLRNAGLRRKYQLGCPHVLYGDSCKASELANTETGVITKVVDASTMEVQLSGAALGVNAPRMLAGLFKTITDDGMPVIRSIINAEDLGNRKFRVYLMSYVPSATAGLTCSVSKGCPHTFEACRDTFANVSNFGGCPNIPVVSPYKNNQF